MKNSLKALSLAAAALAVGAVAFFWSGDIPRSGEASLVTEAQAIIGRPLTPVSFAGVARRTVRRCAVGVYRC